MTKTLSPAARAFLLGLAVIWLELCLIRWLPAHILYLGFFSNVVLLAAFLGCSLGCLAAESRRDLAPWTAPALAAAMAGALGLELVRLDLARLVDLGSQAAPEMVYFGAEAFNRGAGWALPAEAVAGGVFLAVAVVFLGPGQALGRCLKESRGALAVYAANLLGSLCGALLFAGASALGLGPVAWFVPVLLLLELLLRRAGRDSGRGLRLACWGLVAAAAWQSTRGARVDLPGPDGAPAEMRKERIWSPYYRVEYMGSPLNFISVNLLGHQRMLGTQTPYSAYALPYLLRRDAGAPPPDDVLVIGAGSGNDVARALQWGARRVDAVEIDPVLVALGRRDHPDRPYADPRVTVHVTDGRQFLRRTGRRYDLIVYALVDSLAAQSAHGSIRLESYLFTREAYADARAHLKPGGLFAAYNFYRQGWIVNRLHDDLAASFGADPLVITDPYRARVGPETQGGLTLLMAGDTAPLERAFGRRGTYWIRRQAPPSLAWADGFRAPPAAARGGWKAIKLSASAPSRDLKGATDDWPFLYLRRPVIPVLNMRGMALMALLSALLLALLAPAGAARGLLRERRMLLLGAGFMLIEAKAVIAMALLLGSTWRSSAAVLAGVLAVALAAAWAALRRRPRGLGGLYAGLFASLVLAALVPLGTFLGLPRGPGVCAAALVAFLPLFFSGTIFSACLARSPTPARGLGANLAGAMLGGLLENAALVVGFRALGLVALALYALSALPERETA